MFPVGLGFALLFGLLAFAAGFGGNDALMQGFGVIAGVGVVDTWW